MWWRRLRYVLLLIALCAIATCPAAKRSCTARTRSAEADQLLGYLADRVAALPNLTVALSRRGVAPRVLEKILGGNVLRVLDAVPAYGKLAA